MVSSAKGGGEPSNLVRTSGAPAESLMICKQKLLFIYINTTNQMIQNQMEMKTDVIITLEKLKHLLNVIKETS